MPNSAREEKNLQIVRDALLEGAHDFTKFFAKIFTEDTRWEIAGHGPVAGFYHGLKDLHDRAEAALFDRLQRPLEIKPRGLWADGDDVIARIDSTGIAIDGEPYANGYLYILTLENGKVVSGVEWLDLHAYYEIVDRVRL